MLSTVIKVGLFICAFFLFSAHTTSALPGEQFSLTDDPLGTAERAEKTEAALALKAQEVETEQARQKAEAGAAEKAKQAAARPKQYTVAAGDTLSKIAQAQQTTWLRLYAKNLQIADPNILKVGEVITVPLADEQLAERALPEPAAPPQPQSAARPVQTSSQSRGNSAGNTYAGGYCTWYAKSRRPDLPNRMGNASAWVRSAAAQGFATGSTPRAGAVGQQGNHVVYVEGVNGDGTVTISEMNYKGLFVISSRTASASSFTYIY